MIDENKITIKQIKFIKYISCSWNITIENVNLFDNDIDEIEILFTNDEWTDTDFIINNENYSLLRNFNMNNNVQLSHKINQILQQINPVLVGKE